MEISRLIRTIKEKKKRKSHRDKWSINFIFVADSMLMIVKKYSQCTQKINNDLVITIVKYAQVQIKGEFKPQQV